MEFKAFLDTRKGLFQDRRRFGSRIHVRPHQTPRMDWPNDVDGDVFRRMEESGFDFAQPHLIDFNVDFEGWPPMKEAVALIKRWYPNTVIHEPRGKDHGYVQFRVHARVSYDLVMKVQREVSNLMADFGGRCESWGVMQDEV